MSEKEIKPKNYLKIFIIICLIIVIGFIFINKKDKKIKIEENKPINIKFEDQTSNHILFENLMIVEKQKEFYFSGKATNLTSNTLITSPITITFQDKNGNVLATMTTYIGEKLNPNESKGLSALTNTDLKSTKKVLISIKVQV